jgi:hypothetical protein
MYVSLYLDFIRLQMDTYKPCPFVVLPMVKFCCIHRFVRRKQNITSVETSGMHNPRELRWDPFLSCERCTFPYDGMFECAGFTSCIQATFATSLEKYSLLKISCERRAI